MTVLATGASATVVLKDDGICKVSSNGGAASVSITPTVGAASVVSLGPLPARQTFGPYSEGATIVISNQTAQLEYDVPGFDPANVAITGGTVSNANFKNASVAGPRAITPDQISGLQLWLDASQPMFTASYAAQVATAGDQIAIWPDRSGNGRTVNGSATKPTYDPVGMNGKPTINFNGNSSFVSGSFFDTTYNNGFTMFVVSKAQAAAGNKVIMGCASNGFYFAHNESAKSYSPVFASLVGSLAVTTPALNRSGVGALRWNGSTSQLQYDRYFQPDTGTSNTSSISSNAKTLTGVPGLTGAITIGDLAGGGFTWPGQISEVLIWNTALTNEQCRTVHDYLSAKWGFYTKKFVLCAGNSLTSGTNSTGGPTQTIATSGTNYPGQMWAALGATNYDVQTDAFPGRSTASLLAGTPTYGDLLYMPTASASNVCVVWELTNELSQGLSGQNAYDKIVQYCKARRAQGYTVVVCTCLPRNDGVYAGFEAERIKVNTLIRSNYLTFADGLADVAADTRLQVTTNTTYFGADQVHLTDAGYAVVAGIVAPAVVAAGALTPPVAPAYQVVVDGGKVDNTPIGRGGAADASFTTVKATGVRVSEGTNAKQGAAVLVAGAVVVANTSVTANSRILLTGQVDGGTVGFQRVSARTAGTSFTITSSSGTDTSTVAYEIFEPA